MRDEVWFVIITLWFVLSAIVSFSVIGFGAFAALHWVLQLNHDPAIIAAGTVTTVLGATGFAGLAAGAHN